MQGNNNYASRSAKAMGTKEYMARSLEGIESRVKSKFDGFCPNCSGDYLNISNSNCMDECRLLGFILFIYK